MSELRSELLCEVLVDADWRGMIDVGATPRGNRQIVYIRGGTFEGPKMKGEVLPGGGDWFVRRPDGVVEIDTRVALRTEDGHVIYADIRGANDMPVEVGLRILSGEVVDSSEYYSRITPILETASEKYGWLNRVITVGIGSMTAKGAHYKVYLIR